MEGGHGVYWAVLTDDTTGSPAPTSVLYGLDGTLDGTSQHGGVPLSAACFSTAC